jgi:hypothetical protein
MPKGIREQMWTEMRLQKAKQEAIARKKRLANPKYTPTMIDYWQNYAVQQSYRNMFWRY